MLYAHLPNLIIFEYEVCDLSGIAQPAINMKFPRRCLSSVLIGVQMYENI